MSVLSLFAYRRPLLQPGDYQAPVERYIDANEALGITSQSSVTGAPVEIRGRILRRSGVVKEIRIIHTPTGNRLPLSEAVQVGEGFLLGLVCVPAGAPLLRGQCYVSVYVTVGQGSPAVVLSALFADYVSTGYNLGWPGGPIRPSTDGPGYTRTFQIAAPAPGVDVGFNAPSGARWRPQSVRVSLTTSAVVATRSVQLLLADNTPLAIWVIPASRGQGAGFTFSYSWTLAVTFLGASPTEVPGNLPPDQMLEAGWLIQTQTVNLDVADQLSALTVEVEEWIQSV